MDIRWFVALAMLCLAPGAAGQSGFAPTSSSFFLGGADAPAPPWRLDPSLALHAEPLPTFDRRDFDAGATPVAGTSPEAGADLDAAALAGSSDGLGAPRVRVGFHGLPGGIVLGRTAVPTFEAGLARPDEPLEWTERGLALALADGRRAWLAERRPEVLAACIDFVLRADGSDVLIDIRPDTEGPRALHVVRVAPELDVAPLRGLLRLADGLPGDVLPGTLFTKSMILDEAVQIAVDGERLVASTSLEVRVLRPADGARLVPGARLHSVYRIPAEGGRAQHAGGSFLGEAPLALSRGLGALQDLAGLLGVLRWAEARDPGCLLAIRGELGVGPRRSPLSLGALPGARTGTLR